MIDHYDWAGGREAMLRFGPDTGPVVVAALPLFEEANRTRAFVVTILRALADRGIASALPDLPGQGESLAETANASMRSWRQAFAAAAAACSDMPPYGIALRGGALIDTDAELAERWHFAPMLGDKALRELKRAAITADPQRRDLDSLDFESNTPVEIAGNLLSPALLGEIGAARPAPARIVRLTADAAEAALKVDGTPLWRRAEPDNDPALAALLADDIATWVRTCEA